jgi:hypothetical protein
VASYKKFNPEEYSECNDIAIQTVRTYFDQRGTFTCSFENYDVDIIAITLRSRPNFFSFNKTFHEVEVKRLWIDEWPSKYKTIHIPQRKHKLIERHGADNLYFWILRNDCLFAQQLHAKDVIESKLIELPTKNRAANEIDIFFNVPITKCKLITF